MPSSREQLDFVLDQMSGAGAISARAMFGEYGIYCDGKIVALFCDDRLFVKPTPAGRAFARSVAEAPPYPGAKPYLAIDERMEDREWLTALIRATAAALPAPRKTTTPRRPRRRG